jgi:fatty acid desaturase
VTSTASLPARAPRATPRPRTAPKSRPTPTPHTSRPDAERPAPHLTPAQIEALGEELDALRQRVTEDLGERDVRYIRNIIRAQRALEVSGRGLLFLSILPPAWLAGVAALSLSKILDNMEIGHNVMHGQ